MMGLETINELSREAAKKAKRTKLLPLVLAEAEDSDKLGSYGYRIPDFGDYRPKGWKLVDEWLCDSSGFGAEYERALTVPQLRERMKEKITEGKQYGYGTISQGQFQVVLGVFEQEAKKGRKGATRGNPS
jgi:hypothetical protein